MRSVVPWLGAAFLGGKRRMVLMVATRLIRLALARQLFRFLKMSVVSLQFVCSLNAALLDRMLVPAYCFLLVWLYHKRSSYVGARET